MNRRFKRVVTVAATIIFAGLLFFCVKFLIDAPYRRQLPALPGSNSVTKPVLEQIADARRQAYFFTSASNLGKLGMAYHSCADYKNAALCYGLAAKKSSGDWQWPYYLGYLNLEQGELEEALENFLQVTQKDPQNNLAYYYQAQAYQKLGSTDRAEKILKQLCDAGSHTQNEKVNDREAYFPLQTYAAFNLARIYLESDRTDSAKAVLKRTIDEQITFGPAYRLLGNVYSKKEDSAQAAHYMLRANDLAGYTPPVDNLMDKIALASRSEPYLLKQIDDAVRSGNHRWALTLCNHLLAYAPDNKQLISTAIVENFRYGMDKKGLLYLDKHFSLFADDAGELMDVTDMLYDKGFGDDALRYFNQVKKLMPQNSSLALWLFDRGKKDEAIAFMNKLVGENPKEEKIIADATRLWINIGEDEPARLYLARLQQVAPDGAELAKVSGLMAKKKGAIREALSFYEKAFALDPKDLPFTKELIDVFVKEKAWKEVIRYFRMGLQNFPNDPSLLEGLGRLLIACPDTTFRNMPEGVDYSERAFINQASSYKTKLDAGKNLATAYVSIGDKKKAAKFINMTIALAKEGNNSQEYISYFSALVAKGKG